MAIVHEGRPKSLKRNKRDDDDNDEPSAGGGGTAGKIHQASTNGTVEHNDIIPEIRDVDEDTKDTESYAESDGDMERMRQMSVDASAGLSDSPTFGASRKTYKNDLSTITNLPPLPESLMLPPLQTLIPNKGNIRKL